MLFSAATGISGVLSRMPTLLAREVRVGRGCSFQCSALWDCCTACETLRCAWHMRLLLGTAQMSPVCHCSCNFVSGFFGASIFPEYGGFSGLAPATYCQGETAPPSQGRADHSMTFCSECYMCGWFSAGCRAFAELVRMVESGWEQVCYGFHTGHCYTWGLLNVGALRLLTIG